MSPEDKALLLAVNEAIEEESFDTKEDIIKARELFAEGINRGLSETDSLVLVESIADDGVYAKKGLADVGEFSKVQVTDTPFEALTFLDAIQMNKFESFLTARKKDIPESDAWWLITFVSKNGGSYSAKNYCSK